MGLYGKSSQFSASRCNGLQSAILVATLLGTACFRGFSEIGEFPKGVFPSWMSRVRVPSPAFFVRHAEISS